MSLILLERVAGYRAPLPPHPARPIFPLYCGAEGGRTLDLSIANAALSQLSYGPIRRKIYLILISGCKRSKINFNKIQLLLFLPTHARPKN